MQERRILESWKEISDYLKRSTKTCQRWEIELGLPIHRLDGTPKARVFAYAHELDNWLAEKPALTEAPSEDTKVLRRPKARRFFIAASGLVVLTVLIFGIWRMLPSKPLPIPSPKPSLAVLYFENTARDESLEAWRRDLPHLIMIDLMQSRFIDVASPGTILWAFGEYGLLEAKTCSAADLVNVAKKIAEHSKLDYFASGGLLRSGDKIIVTVSVQKLDAPDEKKQIQAVYRDEADMMTKVDGLTRDIKRAMNLSPRYISCDLDEDAAKIATPFPQAFHIYCQALWAPPKEGEDRREVVPILSKAVEIDPEFALAYESMYQRSNWLGREHNRKTYLRKAFDLSDRLSVKDRLLVQGDYCEECREHWEGAMRAWERLWAIYPGEWSARLRLFRVYMDAEEWDKAIPLWEEFIAGQKRGSSLDAGLAACYAAKGMYDKAEELLDGLMGSMGRGPEVFGPERLFYYYLKRDFQAALDCLEQAFPSQQDTIEYRYRKGMHFYYQDDFPAAEREFRRMRELDSKGFLGLDSIKLVFLDQGKVEEARKVLRGALEEAINEKALDWQAGFHTDLAYLNCLSADYAGALQEIDQAALAQSKFLAEIGQYKYYANQHEFYLQVLHDRALIALELNDIKLYEQQLTEIKAATQRGAKKKALRLYFHLLGQRELRRGRLTQAVSYFEKVLSLQPFQYPDSDNCLHRYYFSLAEAYERAGNLEKARETYEQLTRLNKREFGDLYARSYYRLGKIHERLGQWAPSIENYRKFLDLWKDADPIFAEVPDAKLRLAGLEAR